jgi:hypothetical protein
VKRRFLLPVLLAAFSAQAQSLTWYTTKAEAFQAAAAAGQRVLLVVGTAGCGNCEYTMGLCATSLYPLVSSEYATWYDDYNLSPEYKEYWQGEGSVELPLLTFIDPNTPANYAFPSNFLFETFGLPILNTFSNQLYRFASYTNAVMGPCVLNQGTAQVNISRLTYGAAVTVERSTALAKTNTVWQTVECYTNAAGKTHTFVDTNALPRAFYRVHCTR